MEAHVAASSDVLIDSLNFRPQASGAFVTESRAVRFQSESAQSFTPTSQRLLRFRLTSNSWLDPLSCKLTFDLRNAGGTGLKLLAPNASTLFSRARVICGSVVCDDLDSWGRTVCMLDTLKPANRVQNDVIMNGGGGLDATLQLSSGTLETILAGDRSYNGLLTFSAWPLHPKQVDPAVHGEYRCRV
jgi:hypothetical protein